MWLVGHVEKSYGDMLGLIKYIIKIHIIHCFLGVFLDGYGEI